MSTLPPERDYSTRFPGSFESLTQTQTKTATDVRPRFDDFQQFPDKPITKEVMSPPSMKNTLLITCPKCGYRINGRLWRCPQCGDTDTGHKKGNTGKSQRGFRGGIIDALRARKTKVL
jgi:rubrerythrin